MLWFKKELGVNRKNNSKPLAMVARERAMNYGVQGLGLEELLATLLGGSIPDETLIILTKEGIKNLSAMTVEEYTAFPGIGKSRAAILVAAFEIARKLSSTLPEERKKINSPEDAATLVMEEMRHLDREHFCVLLLNTKHQVMARETVSVGTLNTSVVHPRELFKSAIRRSASAIILVHNHPSGDPTPSREDVEVTRRMQEAGKIVGIEILDHIIIGDMKHVSFKAKGMI